MNCNDIRKLHQLQLDGEWLSPVDAETVSRHRAQCSVCAHELEQQEKLTAALHALPAVDAPATALTALRSALKEASPVAPMTCAQCRQALADYADRQLPAHLSEQVAVHLATCTQCTAAAAAAPADEETTALLAALPEVTPPADLRAALKRRLSGPEARPVAPLACSEAERLLSERLDEELSVDAQSRLEVHLANCTACTRFAAALDEQQALLRSLAEAPAPADLPQQIAARLAAQRLSTMAVLFQAIRRSRQTMLSLGLGAVATICVALGVMNANHRAPVTMAPAVHQQPLVRQREATRPTPPHELPTRVATQQRPAEPTPAPVVRIAENIPPRLRRSSRAVRVRAAASPSVEERTPASSLAPRAPVTAPSPALAAGNDTSEPATPAAELATPPSASQPIVASTRPDAEALAAAGIPTTTGPADKPSESSTTASPVTPAAAATTPETPAPARPTTPAPSPYVDDSPDHAPSPSALPQPEDHPSAERAEPPAFEAPPVETATAVASTAPPTKKTDQLAELRRQLHRRRPLTEASERIAGKPDKMATVDLLKVQF